MRMVEETSLTSLHAGATKKIASRLAKDIAATKSDHARVIALRGNLGAGKTTFAQGFARAFGVKMPVTSPTFVLMKIYALPLSPRFAGEAGRRSFREASEKKKYLKHLVHIDAYRIESAAELEHLGFRELLNDKDAVILIEWAERVKDLLPEDTIWLNFEHGKNINERVIQIKSQNAKVKSAGQKSK